MAITTKNLYYIYVGPVNQSTVESGNFKGINEPGKLSNTYAYNDTLYDSSAFQQVSLYAPGSNPLVTNSSSISAAKKKIQELTKRRNFSDDVIRAQNRASEGGVIKAVATAVLPGQNINDAAEYNIVIVQGKYGSGGNAEPAVQTKVSSKPIRSNFDIESQLQQLRVLRPEGRLQPVIERRSDSQLNLVDVSKFDTNIVGDPTSLGTNENNRPKIFKFVYQPLNSDIIDLVDQTKLTLPQFGGANPFRRFDEAEVDNILSIFFDNLFAKLQASGQSELYSACVNFLNPSSRKKKEDSLISAVENSLDSLREASSGTDEKTRSEQIADGASQELKEFWASEIIVEDFANGIASSDQRVIKGSRSLIDTINNTFLSSSVENNRNENTVFGTFCNKYEEYFKSYYKLLDKSEVKREKKSDIKKKKDEVVGRASLSVTQNLAQQERDFNRLQAESQIIRVSGTGVNKFTHPAFENTMSILDILRDEQPLPSFSETHAVKETSGEQLTSSTDKNSACNNILNGFPVSLKLKMTKNLLSKKAIYLKDMFKSLFSLKKLQNDPSFKVLGFFSGFGGIDFTQFLSLSFDPGDFDAAKFRSLFSFSELRGQLNNAYDLTKSLLPKNIANRYLSQLSGVAGILTGIDVSLSKYLADNFGSVDFQKYIKNIPTSDLKSCPSFSALKSEIENASDSTKSILTKTKGNLGETIKKIHEHVTNIDKSLSKIESIDKYTNLIQSNIDGASANIIDISNVARQKASSVGLGTNITNDLVNLNPNKIKETINSPQFLAPVTQTPSVAKSIDEILS